MKLFVEKENSSPVEKQITEIVERKGIGHPDSICDGIVEVASRAVSSYYVEKKGFICHHNLDKGLLVGGIANPTFGGGEIVKSPEITVAGTATVLKDDSEVEMIIHEKVEDYLKTHIRFIDELDPKILVKIHPGSKDLVEVYERIQKGNIPLANDTSIGVGFAPMTVLEELVFLTEVLLNSKKIKKSYPWIGEDVKVMGIRNNSDITLTVAVAFVSQFVNSLEEYYNYKEKLKEVINKKFGNDIAVFINTADNEDSVYLTVTGLSCENGDDGQVGRGNRVNGLITPCRPMSLEAAAGKNCRTHVGKIYNLKAREIAENIAKDIDVQQVYVQLLSQIGKPINDPFISIKYISDWKIDLDHVREIVEHHLSKESFEKLVDNILNDSITVF